MKRNYYEVLGIMPGAPQEIVTAVYRTWMHALKMHPDLGGDLELAKEINAAYEVLKDPGRRKKYDGKLSHSLEMAMPNESRRAPRFKVDASVAVMIQGEREWRKAQAFDASVLGLRLQSGFAVEIGMHATIAFEGSASPAVESAIKWMKELDGDRFEFGVEFFQPIPDILKRLGCRP